MDGESENISLRTFDILMRNSAWRLQVLLVQSALVAATETEGWFGAQKKVCVSSTLTCWTIIKLIIICSITI